MSQKDQDAILGRTTRQYRELQRSLALIDAELETFCSDLSKLTKFANARVRLSGKHPDSPVPQLPGDVSRYIDLTQLQALIDEQDDQVRRIRSLVTILKDLEA